MVPREDLCVKEDPVSQKPNRIHVKRYPDPHAVGGWESVVEPEDRAWIVFVPTKGTALFYRRYEVRDENGKIEHAYADVELPGTFPVEHPDKDMPAEVSMDGRPLYGPGAQPHVEKTHPGPIDFHVEPGLEPCLDAISAADHARERELYPNAREGFYAFLNCRSYACWGVTPHEAVQGLLNAVVRLAAAGCLDHTGKSMRRGTSARRYEAVFGYKQEPTEPTLAPNVPPESSTKAEREYPQGRCQATKDGLQCWHDAGHKRWHETDTEDRITWVNTDAPPSLF